MKRKKANRTDSPKCGIHTVRIATSNILDFSNEFAYQCTSKISPWHDKNTGEIINRITINPNKWNRNINSYSTYQYAMSEIMESLGIRDYRLTRIDFSLDYMVDNYIELHKINKCVCLLISLSYKMKNQYESTDPLSLNHLTTRVQNGYIECENYNKNIESNHSSPVFNRLELRTKALLKTKKDIPQVATEWVNRLDTAVTKFNKLQAACNNALIEKWHIEDGVRVKRVSEFIRKYQNNFYSRNQLVDFYRILDHKNPESAAKSIKRHNSIEFISDKELQAYVAKIKGSIQSFMTD